MRCAIANKHLNHCFVVVRIAPVLVVGNVLAEPVAVDVVIVVTSGGESRKRR